MAAGNIEFSADDLVGADSAQESRTDQATKRLTDIEDFIGEIGDRVSIDIP